MLSPFSTTVAKTLSLIVVGVFFLTSTAVAAESGNFLTTNLSLGDEGAEVTLLQTWLSEDPELYPEQVVNGIFGPATERAVQRFQRSVGVISADPSGGGRYGKVGPITRASLNARFSDIKGGVASVEGSYDSMMRYDGASFVQLSEKVYDLNADVLQTFEAWINPTIAVERLTPVLGNGGGYSVGLLEGGRLYATSPKGNAATTKSSVRAGEWQHVAVLFTATDAVFLYDNQVLEIVPLAVEKRVSFFGNIFEKVAGAFSMFFPSVPYTPSEETISQPMTTEAPDTGIVGSFVSFARGLFGLPPLSAPAPVTVTEVEPLGLGPVVKSIPAPSVMPAPLPLPAITIPTIFTPTTTPTLTLAGTTTSTSSVTTTATTTAVVATTTKSSKPQGKTPKDSTPLITLIGSSRITVAPGGVYTDPGATAFDLEDGDLTNQITVGGDTIDYDTPDTYHITYNVWDSSGEKAKEVIRNVTIMGIPELSPEQQEPNYDLAAAGQSVEYTVSSEADADPKFISIEINPLHVYVGDTQTFTVKVSSESGVESVTTSTELDTVTHELALEKIDNTTFEGSWVVYDTHVRDYRTEFTARSGSGSENSMTMAWSDPCAGVTQGVSSTLTNNCTVSTVYGLDGGNLTLGGFTLTINSGGTWGFNPGTTVTVDGTLSKGTGGAIKKGYLFYQDCSGCVDTNTMYFFSTTPQTGYTRTSTYSQPSYYSEPGYYTEPFYCFAPQTQVLLPNGTSKPIREVELGELVMGQTEDGKLRPNVVTKLYHHTYTTNDGQQFDTLKINGDLIVTAEHPMMTTRGIVSAGELSVGDMLIGLEGSVPVTSIEGGPLLPQVYNLSVYPDHTYFANDLLVHNKGMHGLPP